jgi:hypothetical protein
MESNAQDEVVVAPLIDPDPGMFRAAFNRASFTFSHGLHRQPLFALPRLARLAETMLAAGDQKKFLALGGEAAAAGSTFESLPRQERLARTIEELECSRNWVKLSSAESFDREYRELLETLLAQIAHLSGRPLLEEITSPGRPRACLPCGRGSRC